MNESTESPKRAKALPAAKATKIAVQATARITRKVPRESGALQKLIDRKLGGEYRVIHGRLAVPRPNDEWHNADGSVNGNELPYEYAVMGDVLTLSDLEAAKLLDDKIVEPLDAKPSMVGKMWKPPPAKPLAKWAKSDDDDDDRGINYAVSSP